MSTPTAPLMALPAGQQVTANPLLQNLSKREIPSLYGLRGVSAMVIVVWHYLQEFQLSHYFPGPFAVTLFFELSGLLITWLILSEQEAAGEFDFRRFYARRALRLFPVFYVVWGLCRLAGPFAGSSAYFFYAGDYYTALHQNYSAMTPAWSLGVEEKFYLLWPLILTYTPRKKLIAGSIAVLIIEPVYRLVLTRLGYQTYTWFAFDAKLDAIVLGCLLALLVKQGSTTPRWLNYRLTPLCALGLVFVFQTWSDVVTYLLAVILAAVICRPPKLLNNRPVRFLGAISYSLYLSHVYARSELWQRFFGQFVWRSVPLVLLIEVAIALLLASALHFSVERPFLRLKARFERVKG